MAESLFVIGGSSVYTLLLLRALDRARLLPRLDRVTLFGRDARRLDYLAKAGAQIAAASGAHTTVDATTAFEACLDERYRILFNQIRIGGMAARDRDERAALLAGLPADETLGAVGLTNAVRTLIGLEPCLETLRRKRGDFLVVNFTNPCSIVTQAMVERYGLNAVGLCDYPVYFRDRIAEHLARAPEETEISYFGLNHLAFVHDVRVGGQSAFHALMAQVQDFALALPYQRHFPFLLVPGWDFLFRQEAVFARQSAEPANRAAFLLDVERRTAAVMTAGRDPEAAFAILEARNAGWYESAVVPFLEHHLNGVGGEAIVNADAGNVFGLGRACCVVETNATIRGGRAHPAPVPAAVAGSALFDLCRLLKRAELCLLDGIARRDADAVLQACLVAPPTACADRIRRYLRHLGSDDPLVASVVRPA